METPLRPPHCKWAWPGAQEEIVVCGYKGISIFETFHWQDFFFLNYAYKGSYDAISYRYDNYITVNEGECYVGRLHWLCPQ